MCCAREVYVWWIFNVMWSSPIKTVDYFISRLTKYQNYFIKINQIITLTDSHLWSKPAVIQRRQRSRYKRLTHFVCIIVESQVMDNRPYKLEQESFRSMFLRRLCSFPAGVCKKALRVDVGLFSELESHKSANHFLAKCKVGFRFISKTLTKFNFKQQRQDSPPLYLFGSD